MLDEILGDVLEVGADVVGSAIDAIGSLADSTDSDDIDGKRSSSTGLNPQIRHYVSQLYDVGTPVADISNITGLTPTEISDVLHSSPETAWKPIDTAPKDGTVIIVRDSVGGIHGVKWMEHRDRYDWFHAENLGWVPSAVEWIPVPE